MFMSCCTHQARLANIFKKSLLEQQQPVRKFKLAFAPGYHQAIKNQLK